MGTMTFKRSKERLHCHQFSPEFIKSIEKQGTQSLSAIKENTTGNTNQQQERAKEAQQLCHIIGAPTAKNFKHLIESNQIQNCPVTLEDIDVSHVKGKTMRRNPIATTAMTVTMPKELKEQNENITSHIDMMHVNKIGFMTSMSHPLCCCGCKHVANNAKDSFHNALDKMF